MKKLIVVSLLALTLASCVFLDAQKPNWKACAADQDCLADAKGYQAKAELTGIAVASAIPLPGAAAAPKVFGYIAFAIAMLLGGRALNKKKYLPNT